MREEEQTIDLREIGRAAAGLLTMLLATVLAQVIVFESAGILDLDDADSVMALEGHPGPLFLAITVSASLTGMAAVLFSSGPIRALLSRVSALRFRAFLFGPVAALALGQAVSFFVVASPLAPSEGNALIAGALAESSSGILALAYIAIAFAAPVGEELFFRGFLLDSLNRALGAGLAILLSAALFGLIHFDPIQALATTLIGFVLGSITVATRSLWPALWTHAINNGFYILVNQLALPETAPAEAPIGIAINVALGLVSLGLGVGCLLLAVGGKQRLLDLLGPERARLG